MSTTKLDDKHAIPGDIIYLHTVDRRPIRVVYPLWNTLYPSSFKNICQEYLSGKNNSGKNCYNQVKNILDSIFNVTPNEFTDRYKTQYKTIIDGLLPISPYKESKYPRELYAYGIYAALSCGMQLDFTNIVEKCNYIKANIYDLSQRKNVDRVINTLVTDVRRMNHIGNMLTAPANTSATCTNIIRALTMDDKQIAQLPEHVRTFVNTFNKELHERVNNPNLYRVLQRLTPAQFKELVLHVDTITVKHANMISANVSSALSRISHDDLYWPKKEEALKTAAIEDVINNMINRLGSLPRNGLTELSVLDAIKGSVSSSFENVEKIAVSNVCSTEEAAHYVEQYTYTEVKPDDLTNSDIDNLANELEAHEESLNSDSVLN